jgi:hypothetical protein
MYALATACGAAHYDLAGDDASLGLAPLAAIDMDAKSTVCFNLSYASVELMRLTLKHQIILAPATVLLAMTLLLGFLQFTYWDLSLKRQEARRLGTIFIALAEADLAAQRSFNVANRLRDEALRDLQQLGELEEIHFFLRSATERYLELMDLPEPRMNELRQIVAQIDPEQGFDPDRIIAAVNQLRPELAKLSGTVQHQRGK